MADDDRDRQFAVEVARIIEGERTKRIAVVSIAGTVAIWIIADAVTKIMNNPQPAWLTLALAIVGGAGLGSAPGLIALKWVKRFIERHTGKRKALEEKVDPGRLSSDVGKDGTLPHD